MMEEKELLKKMSKLFEETKKRKINDFDSGLLQESFEHITGSPQEKYDKWCERLVNVAARLENLHLDDEKRPVILDEIDKFFEIKLPCIRADVSDFREKERVVEIHRLDEDSITNSATIETFEKTINAIREEQYSVLTNKARSLVYQAMARLTSDIFTWHKDGMIEIIHTTEQSKEDVEHV